MHKKLILLGSIEASTPCLRTNKRPRELLLGAVHRDDHLCVCRLEAACHTQHLTASTSSHCSISPRAMHNFITSGNVSLLPCSGLLSGLYAQPIVTT